MPIKLLGTVILLIVVTIFCGFNLGEAYRCNINLLFHTFENVPVFFTVLISFLSGVLIMFPFTIGNARHRAEQKAAEEKARQERLAAREQAKADAQAKKAAELAERKRIAQEKQAEKDRKAQEKLAKKHPDAVQKAQVTAANEVPVITPEPHPAQ